MDSGTLKKIPVMQQKNSETVFSSLQNSEKAGMKRVFWEMGFQEKTVRQETEQSLKRLGVDRIDLMQIHWPRPDSEIESAWTEMCRLMDEGKIRAVGVSNFNVSQLERIKKIRLPASLQPPYCVFRREIEKEILPWCRENNVGVICYSPMYYGLLAEKFDEERISKMACDDWRKRLPELNENHRVYCEFYDRFKKNCRRKQYEYRAACSFLGSGKPCSNRSNCWCKKTTADKRNSFRLQF